MNILAKNLLILASAGSGKTFQLSNRIIGLIAQGIAPEKIVALTFTRKAAGEFADAVLNKLADAASDPATSKRLLDDLNLTEADFQDALSRVVRSLHRITLGTMDSFFAKVVRGFQYELGLTGGRFDLIEGPQAEAISDDILNAILSDVLVSKHGTDFSHAFRRATIGKEEQSIHLALRGFIRQWHLLYRESPHREWGPEKLANIDPKAWEKQKSALKAVILDGIETIEFTDKRQPGAFKKAVQLLADHTIGSGSLGSGTPKLVESILAQSAITESGALELQSYKPFTILGETADTLRTMARLAAQCEYAAALERTRAVREVIEAFDHQCAIQLREKGRLGFNDVKLLMGQWALSEDARLRREAVDFRLDARIDHWLLDEFQDTSRADWNGLLPLIDEAAAEGGDGTLFVVGDRKQAIYAWRGGDVSLFDEVLQRYRGGIEVAPLDESWRSCPEVLELVNQVCGDKERLHELFGNAANQWEWHDHTSAKPLCDSSTQGHAKVEVVGNWEERLERTAEILTQLEIGKKDMTCGILLRGNEKARQLADDLKSRGFDVILEGHREPANDAPIGIAITHLLQWLSQPADPYAWNTVKMSPLYDGLTQLHGADAPDIWKHVTASISSTGFHHTVKAILTLSCPNLSEFGQSRANDLLAALSSCDRQNNCNLKQAAEHIARLQISQSPGTAAVQVMTIHKSKGLGFDVVILPEIPPNKIPEAQYFDIAKGDDWLTETPAQWAREFIPELCEQEEVWGNHQRYESFCTLYVAMTRAKRGLYVLLDESKKSESDPFHPTLLNWVKGSAQNQPTDEDAVVLYESGASNWVSSYDPLEDDVTTLSPTTLPAIQTTASATANIITPSKQADKHPSSVSGLKFGSEVHSLLERVAWIDDTTPTSPSTAAGKLVDSILTNTKFESVFRRNGRSIRLLREQAVDCFSQGSQVSGIIDRLHLHLSDSGAVEHIDIIDFKTDSTGSPEDLAASYTPQLQRYRESIALIYPDASISCQLLLSHHGELIEV